MCEKHQSILGLVASIAIVVIFVTNFQNGRKSVETGVSPTYSPANIKRPLDTK